MESFIYERVSDKKERILSLWRAAASPQGGGLLLEPSSEDRFTAPADFVYKEQVELLFDWLISDEEIIKARPALQELCKLKAVQALNPSEALGFIPELKGIIRLVIGDQNLSEAQCEEYKELEKRIDKLMLLAFDEYEHCREQIMEIRVDEVRRLHGKSQQ